VGVSFEICGGCRGLSYIHLNLRQPHRGERCQRVVTSASGQFVGHGRHRRKAEHQRRLCATWLSVSHEGRCRPLCAAVVNVSDTGILAQA